MKHKLFKICILSGASLFLMLAGTASATTFTYTVAGGFEGGHACLSSEASGACALNSTFEVAPGDSFPISGTFTYDDVSSTIDIDITLASGTMFGGHDGISEVIFTNVNYVVNAAPVTLTVPPGMLFAGPGAGTVTGTYEQSDGTSTVLGPDAINGLSAFFNNFSCSNLDAVGLCGFTVGASRDFALSIGQTGPGDSTDFVQTFSFNAVIPEPTTASLLALGLVGFAFVPRFRR